ncbi:hypothetical protein ACWKW6_20590 [Dyadobacter jiangsuensis]
MGELNLLSEQLTKSAVKYFLSMVPGVGPVVAEVFSSVFEIEISRRQQRYVSELAQRIQMLEDSKQINLTSLAENEKFVDVFLETLSLVRKTSNEEKIRAYQNSVLNTACRQHPDEFYTHTFLQLLDRFTHLHLAVLKVAGHTYQWFVDNDIPWIYTSSGSNGCRIELMICAAVHEIDSPFMLDLIWKDLQAASLVDNTPVDKVFDREDELYESRVTLIGGEFLRFIENPWRLQRN